MNTMHIWPAWLLFVLAALNFALCVAIGWSCVCRFAIMSRSTTTVVWRLRYVTVIVAATTSGISPLWGEWPGAGQLAMACACLYVLGLTARGWKGGPPRYAQHLPTGSAS